MTMEDLEKVKKAVIRKYPIAASLALHDVTIELNTKIPTACVVGEKNKTGVLEVKKMQVNPEFFELLTFSERVFVLAHECCHIALKHFKRATKKPEKDVERKYKEYCEKESDPRKRELMKMKLTKKYHNIWNIATDACINAFLKKDGLSFPSHVVDPKTGEEMKFVDMEDGNFKSAEKIYDYLVKKEEEKEKEKQEQKQENSGGQDGQGKPQKGQGNSQSSSSSNGSSSTTSLDDVDIDDYQGIDSHDEWTGENDDKELDNEDDKSQDNEDQDSDDDEMSEEDLFNDELEERDKKNKKNKSNLKDSFSKIREGLGVASPFEIKPVVSWKRLLVGIAETTKEVWGTRRASRFNPNARIEERTFESMPTVEIIMDSSGSISATLLRGFLLQLYPLFQELYGEEETSIKVGCFGSKFGGFTRIRKRKDIEEYEPYYGGGTDFEVAATSFSYDPGRKNIKIVFTDGELGYPQQTRVDDIIWIVFGNKANFKPVGGRVIRVTDREFDEIMESGKKIEEEKARRHR